jgi:hypothetical protein
MKIKKGASLQGLNPVMREVLVEADKIWESLGKELVVTSGTDGAHRAGSLHYYGYALDFRTRYFSERCRRIAYNRLCVKLDTEPFMVLLQPTHIHVQYTGELK